MWKQKRTTCDAISCGRRGRGNIFSNTGTRRAVCAFSYAAQEPAALTFATYCALAFLASLIRTREGKRTPSDARGPRYTIEEAGRRLREGREGFSRTRSSTKRSGRSVQGPARRRRRGDARRLDGDHLAPGALGIKERKVFESPPEPRARMAVIRDSLSPVDAASAFASAAAARASRRSGGRREPNTPLSRGMSEPERGV